MVVVSGPEMFNDIRKATDQQLSFREAVAEVRPAVNAPRKRC